MNINPLPFALTLGSVTFLLVVIWGAPFVEVLRRLKIGQLIREDSPDWHAGKEGTPTMGGILIVVPVVLIALVLNLVNILRPPQEGTGVSILLPLFVLIGFAALGAVDDYTKLRTRGEGISAKLSSLHSLQWPAQWRRCSRSFRVGFSSPMKCTSRSWALRWTYSHHFTSSLPP